MKIAIDARTASHPQPGGFKTYAENLLRHLPDVMSGGDEIIGYFDRPCDLELRQSRVLPVHLPLLGVALREQWSIPAQARRDKVDVLHFPCSTGACCSRLPVVVTIHDVIGLSTPPPQLRAFSSKEKAKRLGMWLYSRWAVRWAANSAARIMTDSQFSAQEITRVLGISPEKLDVVYPGVAERFHPLSTAEAKEAVQNRYGVDHPYILAIGSASPRKNIASLVRMYAGLPALLRRQFHLVVIWTHGALAPSIQQVLNSLDVKDFVHFIPRVPDDDLVRFYNAATLFVFPSLAEGFGLPLLEAMACGTPVVASSLTSIPEVAGNAAELADPNDNDAFIEALVRVLTNPERRAVLAEAGLKRAGEFRWQHTAKMTLKVYEKVIESHR